ncbi:hypothetical protein SEMRO_2582_G331860.1 [Seminavis robusta]|uniref:Uncharacterized protein n=1 Tax=Seminavis robusta TaxID=568900 RepID=A0A9N8HYP2_9STRA|nr:hypothetical protein SEMRO_2582_G331860.1 [Seminavis robusta]|eukprot:Sro2582_g331860.1 n/a (179) ;mRNA; r:3196-3732
MNTTSCLSDELLFRATFNFETAPSNFCIQLYQSEPDFAPETGLWNKILEDQDFPRYGVSQWVQPFEICLPATACYVAEISTLTPDMYQFEWGDDGEPFAAMYPGTRDPDHIDYSTIHFFTDFGNCIPDCGPEESLFELIHFSGDYGGGTGGLKMLPLLMVMPLWKTLAKVKRLLVASI